MKKYLFSLSLITVAMGGMFSSCSQDDVVSDDITSQVNHGQGIEFVLDVQSRGTDVTLENLTSIWVYAFYGEGSNATECFPVTEFKKNKYGGFKPETPIYWDNSWDNEVSFLAYAPGDQIYTSPNTGTQLNITSIASVGNGDLKIKVDNPNPTSKHVDFITAKTTITKEDSKTGIPLNFEHQLAQVDIQVKIAEDSEFAVELYGARIYEYNNSIGEYSLTNKEWSNKTNSQYSYGVPEAAFFAGTEAQSVFSKSGSAFSIPIYYYPTKFNPVNTVGNHIISLYLKVYDKDRTKVIYPTAKDLEFASRKLDTSSIVTQQSMNTDINYDEVGVSVLSINNDLSLKAGYKYVIVVDLTNGVGYYEVSDPIAPGEPILKPSLGAKVTIEEWKDGDLVSVDANKETEKPSF